ncbi:MAG: CHAP domain-containing protein [Candidatus Saccharimonadales bacterium]
MTRPKKNKTIRLRTLATALVLAIVVTGASIISGVAGADRFDEQIDQLQNQNSTYQSRVDELTAEAASYQDAVNKLEAQINELQQAIVANQRASAQLEKEIKAKEAEIEHQRDVLGQSIKAMYLEGQISTVEILAASRDLSDFVNKQVARNAVQNKIKTLVDEIQQLKIELEQKQRELQARIRDQKLQQADLNAAQNEQARLLNYTEDQKSAFNNKISSNQSRITELRRQQAIENAALFGYGYIKTERCNIYPTRWCNAPMDSIVDTWGMYNRECVSWTAYRVALSGRYMPYWGGRGNANEWDDNARAAGIPVDGNPKAGDVAISNRGYYGHSAYVEAVYDDGTILVSQFNANWQGTYSLARVNTSNFVYIHFP